ncbi:MAG TPA: DUF1579 family protein [Holophagaceae bacterium]|nr:DUF1579 family protein [Holophagaceae bacterium]
MKALVFLLTLPLLSQAPAPPAPLTQGPTPVETMKRLAFLEGHWKGEGSMTMGPGRKVTFQQTEAVGFKAGGAVVAVEGHGMDQGRPVHQAFAVISYDPATKGYRMRSWLVSGLSKDFTLELNAKGDGYTWGWDDPRTGKLRYSMTLTPEGKWREIGERSADGTTWMPFFEMTLTKE